MKICRMMFYSDYVSDEQLLSAIENSRKIDVCYVGLYEKTWSQKEHTNINHQLLKKIQETENNVKIVYMTSEDLKVEKNDSIQDVELKCRNFLLTLAKKEKNNFLFIQDTDEFLLESDYEFLINSYIPEMVRGGFNSAAIRYDTFWKNWNYLIVNEKNESHQSNEDFFKNGYKFSWKNFIINLDSDVYFTEWHLANATKSWILYEIYLFHGSWILTDEQVLQKIKTWGHASDASWEDWEKWYQEKWLKWTPEMESISMENSKFPVWKKAVRYNGSLPKECFQK